MRIYGIDIYGIDFDSSKFNNNDLSQSSYSANENLRISDTHSFNKCINEIRAAALRGEYQVMINNHLSNWVKVELVKLGYKVEVIRPLPSIIPCFNISWA